MEVSNEIKDEIRKSQTDLKNAIRIHQSWVGRLKNDKNNGMIKSKIKEAENDILTISFMQKSVVDRLRHELELYQQKLKVRNKQINSEYDNLYVAQQLQEHQLQQANRNKPISLLKPSVLSEIHIKTENNNVNGSRKRRDPPADSITEYDEQSLKLRKKKEEADDDSEFILATENFSLKGSGIRQDAVQDRRANFTNVLNKAKQNICSNITRLDPPKRSPSPKSLTPSRSGSGCESSPSPSPPSPILESSSPPPLGELITQENFLRAIGLITHRQRLVLEKKRSERKKRSTTSTNKNEFVYGNFEGPQKRKKNNFPYLQQNLAPPQTRAQKMRRQQLATRGNNAPSAPASSSSPPSPSSPPSSTVWPSVSITLPSGLTIEPIVSPEPKLCSVCRQNDAPSLLVRCQRCKSFFHPSCSSVWRSRSPSCSRSPLASDSQRTESNYCPECGEEIHDPLTATVPATTSRYTNAERDDLVKEKIMQKKRLQERNRQLSTELSTLEARTDTLKENMDLHSAEKKHLLSKQIETQKNLRKLLDFVGQFKETSISVRSVSVTDKDSSRSEDEDYLN